MTVTVHQPGHGQLSLYVHLGPNVSIGTVLHRPELGNTIAGNDDIT